MGNGVSFLNKKELHFLTFFGASFLLAGPVVSRVSFLGPKTEFLKVELAEKQWVYPRKNGGLT